MTNEQKLDAVKRGDHGSYNLAPRDGSPREIARFQLIARTTHDVARARDYFWKADSVTEDGEPSYRGVLVTIPRPSAETLSAAAASRLVGG